MAEYLRREDYDNYGTDLLDVSARAAMQAVAPHLQTLEHQNEVLRQQVAKEARHRLDQQVAAAVPSFREIDRNPDWHSRLCGIDALSGEIRQRLLNAAIQRGDSSSVIAFFKKFQQEGGAAQTASAAPGRTRTASSGKPTYTRDLIAQIYEAHRKGAYVGREAEWARQEADLFAAQREGRVYGDPYLTK